MKKKLRTILVTLPESVNGCLEEPATFKVGEDLWEVSRLLVVTTAELARLLRCSTTHVRKLAANGILLRLRRDDGTEHEGRWELKVNLRSYFLFQRGRKARADGSDYGD